MNSEKELSSKAITVSEAFHLLDFQKPKYKNTRSNAYKIYRETLDYAHAFCKIRDRSIAEDTAATLMEMGFTDEEVAAMGSLILQTKEEARICIPSITRLSDSVIERAIEKLNSVS